MTKDIQAEKTYAKNVAIGFAEWINGEMYECFLHTDENEKFWHDSKGKGSLTTEQLYTLYLNQP